MDVLLTDPDINSNEETYKQRRKKLDNFTHAARGRDEKQDRAQRLSEKSVDL